ncbi:MAG: hypothetical protein PHI66_04395 [Candidatus Pacebacteria bacterium]|nr:hypothetical protein [Candidatus Paceibacterota bacterium]
MYLSEFGGFCLFSRTAIKHEAIHAGIKSIYDYLWNILGEKN